MASPDANQLSDGRPAGTKLGQAASDLVGFHGVDPTDQAAAIVSVSTSAAVSVCGAFALTSAQANGLIAAVNALVAMANEKGLIAS